MVAIRRNVNQIFFAQLLIAIDASSIGLHDVQPSLRSWGASHSSPAALPADGETLSLLQGGTQLQGWGQVHSIGMQIPADGMVHHMQDLQSFGAQHSDAVNIPMDSMIFLARGDLTLQSWGKQHGGTVEIPADGMVQHEHSLQHWGGHMADESGVELNPTFLFQMGSDENTEAEALNEPPPEETAAENVPVIVMGVRLLVLGPGQRFVSDVPLRYAAFGALVMLFAALALRFWRGGFLSPRVNCRGRPRSNSRGVLMQCSDRGS